jgi:hypothetical protein
MRILNFTSSVQAASKALPIPEFFDFFPDFMNKIPTFVNIVKKVFDFVIDFCF